MRVVKSRGNICSPPRERSSFFKANVRPPSATSLLFQPHRVGFIVIASSRSSSRTSTHEKKFFLLLVIFIICLCLFCLAMGWEYGSTYH